MPARSYVNDLREKRIDFFFNTKSDALSTEMTGNSRLFVWSSLEIVSGVCVINFFGREVFAVIILSLVLLLVIASAVFSFNPAHEMEYVTIIIRIIKEKHFFDPLSKFAINEYHDYIQIGDLKE